MNDKTHRILDRRVVISSECGIFKTHKPHVIRKGFLGLFRQTCVGYTHRHYMQLRHNPHIKAMGGGYFFGIIVYWKCHCGETWSVNKNAFYKELLGKES